MHFAFMYITDHILVVLSINDLINEDGNLTTRYKVTTGMKPSISHLCLLFCTCFVLKATAYVGTKVLNMSHQSRKRFCGNFVGIL